MTQAKGRTRRCAELAGELLERVESGSTLAEAMASASFIPPAHSALVAAGERSGTLEEVLRRLVEEVDRRREAAGKFLQLALYPVCCLLLAVVLLPLYLCFQGRGSTYLLIEAAFFLPVLALLALVWRRDSLFPEGSPSRRLLEQAALRLPWSGKLLFDMAMARTFQLLGILLQAGISVDESLRLSAGAVRLEALGQEILSLTGHVRGGMTLSEAFGEASLLGSRPAWISRIRVGEKAGSLDLSFRELGDELEASVYLRIRTSLRLLPVFLVPLIGAFVLWRGLSLISEIYGGR